MPITPEWISGFVDGEGCFTFYMKKKSNNYITSSFFTITQNTHDVFVLQKIQQYFNCGSIINFLRN